MGYGDGTTTNKVSTGTTLVSTSQSILYGGHRVLYRTDTTTYYRTDTLYGGYRVLYRIDTTTYYRTDTTTYYGTFNDKNTSAAGRVYFSTSYALE